MTVYLNGNKLNQVEINASFDNSDLPLYEGNWIGGDRESNGLIKEVEVSIGVLAHEDILKNNDLVSAQLH